MVWLYFALYYLYFILCVDKTAILVAFCIMKFMFVCMLFVAFVNWFSVVSCCLPFYLYYIILYIFWLSVFGVFLWLLVYWYFMFLCLHYGSNIITFLCICVYLIFWILCIYILLLYGICILVFILWILWFVVCFCVWCLMFVVL